MTFDAVDFHSHILPDVDDGSNSIDESLEMLSLLKAQGVKKVFATPHFVNHRESIEHFIQKRNTAFEELKKVIPDGYPELILGVEVAFESNLYDNPALKKLKTENSNYIMIELPMFSYNKMIVREIEEIYYTTGLKPIIAHIDRYFNMFSKKDYDNIFFIQEAVFQVNCSAFLNKKFLKVLKNMVLNKLPVIFGSDTHNLNSRKPNFDLINKSKFIRKMSDKMIYLENVVTEISGE